MTDLNEEGNYKKQRQGIHPFPPPPSRSKWSKQFIGRDFKHTRAVEDLSDLSKKMVHLMRLRIQTSSARSETAFLK